MLYTVWTQHITDPDKKSKFVDSVRASKDVLERLQEILKGFEGSLDRSETDIKTYENPNWAYLQADKNGYRRCLNQISAIINLDQQGKQ